MGMHQTKSRRNLRYWSLLDKITIQSSIKLLFQCYSNFNVETLVQRVDDAVFYVSNMF